MVRASVAGILLLVGASVPTDAHTATIHSDLSALALQCAERVYGNWLPLEYRTLLLDGGWQEDYLPPYYADLDPIINGLKTRHHGYNPATRSTGGIFEDAGNEPATNHVASLWGTMTEQFHGGQLASGHDPWQSEDVSAYHWLGRAAHLGQDMTSHPHIHPQNVTALEHSAFESWESSTFHGTLDSYISDSLTPLQPTESLPSEATTRLDAWSRERLQSRTYFDDDAASFLDVIARITYFRTTFWGEVEFVTDTWGDSSGEATQEYTREAAFSDGTVPGGVCTNTLEAMFGSGNVR
jgi:hypothetical protein